MNSQRLFQFKNSLTRSKDDVEMRKRRQHVQRGRSWSAPVRQKKTNLSSASQFHKPNETLNGFYSVIIGNQVFFEGLFQNGRRYGPGVFTFLNSMSQNVGWWQDNQILRLCKLVCTALVPKLSLPYLNNDPLISHNKRMDNFRNNMSAIIQACQYRADCDAKTTEVSLYDLETLLNNQKPIIMVKQCELYSKEIANLEDINEGFFSLANTHTMSDIFKHTLGHINEETSYNIYSFINNSRLEFGKASCYERACIDFLTSCANGDRAYCQRLSANYGINSNLCDGHGNVGLMFAAARDKVEMIMILAERKADFNVVNDDGLTALSMVLLRFIALLRNINNWNVAFINVGTPSTQGQDVKKDVLVKGEGSMPFADIKFYYHDKPLPKLEERLLMNIDQLLTFYGLHLAAPGLQNFQRTYTSSSEANTDAYVFDFRLKKGSKVSEKKSNSNKSSRRIETDTFLRLAVIFNTFMALLHYGSDVSIGNYPLPALFLGLFTESRDVIKMLIKFGADPSTRLKSYHNISVLHALVSMRPGKYLVDIAKILLTVNFDLDARTDGNHWCEERRWVVGNIKEMVDTGKTALHILAMRKDFRADSSCIKQLTELLITKGASCTKRYHGHVPLTLAMLRGNEVLVSSFLKNGSCPNGALGSKMGSPMTLYLLNRFKDQLPSVGTCKAIMHLLLVNGGDPLHKVANSGNAFEFIALEKGRSVRITAKRTSFRRMIKPVKFTPMQITIRTLLLQEARKRMMRHYECLMFMALYSAVKNQVANLKDVGFHLKLSRLMSFDHTLKIAQYLIYYKVLNPVSVQSDYNALCDLFEFIRKNRVSKWKEKKTSRQIIESLTPLEPKGLVPELDMDFENYRVCFTCCRKSGKRLLACPSCGLVHFCSRRCETYSKAYKLHPCKIRFYRDELAQLKFCEEHEIHYEGVHDEVFNNIRDVLLNLITKFHNE